MSIYDALIVQASTAHGIPFQILAGLIRTESSFNPWAFRYEPAFLERYVPEMPQVYGAVSVPTERYARATSWGLMQIMGQVARELGYKNPYLTALLIPEDGVEWGCRHLKAKYDRYFESLGWDGVIAAYNAGTPRKGANGKFVNQRYVDKVRAIQ